MESRLAQEREIVLAQLMATSPTIKLSIGSAGGVKTYTTHQLIQHVQSLDDFGKQFVETQMEFMRGLQNGDIYTFLEEIS